MEFLLLSDPAEFAELARPYLAADPLSTNVIGVQLDSVLAGMRPAGSADLWIVVTDPSNVIGVGMHTPPTACSSRASVPAAPPKSQRHFRPRPVTFRA